jgi:hypothetical protein
MEYLEGEDLHHIISSQRQLSLLEKCNIMSQVADGLAYAHGSGVVHRDMKPANIMVLRDGGVKIMDFGIARITRTPDATRLTQQGFLIGTLRYMAPEQLAGSDFDAQCDIFAYGLIFYELVAGRHPFEAQDAQRLMYRLTFEDPKPIRELVPDAPEALEQVIARMIQKDRSRRYGSMRELQFDAEPVRIDLQKARASELQVQARSLFEQGQLEECQRVLHEALVLDPGNREARGLWERVQQQLQQRTLQPRIEAALSAAEDHLRQRNFADAVQAFESALALDRENVSVRGRLEEARALLDHADRSCQLLAEARKEFEQQNLTAAYRIVSEALRYDPKNPEAGEFLKTIQSYVERRQAEQRVDDAIRKAQGLLLSSAYDEAIAVLLAADPEAPAIREWLERARSEKTAHEQKQKLHREMAAATDLLRARRLDEATQTLENLRTEFPENQDVAHLLAYAQKEQAALRRTKAVEGAAAEAKVHAESRDFESALATLDRALKQYPGDSGLIRLLGNMMAAKSTWERDQALQTTLAKCESLRFKQKFAEAVAIVEAALEEHVADPNLLNLLRQLGEELVRQRRNDAIRKIVEQAEQSVARNQAEAAVELLRQALTRYPGDAVLGELLNRVQGEVLARKKAEAAERAAAIEKRAQDARARSAAGDFEGALALLDEGLRNWPDAAPLQEIRKATLAERERRAKRRRATEQLEEVRRSVLEPMGATEGAELLALAMRIAGEHPQDEQIQSIAAEPIALLSDIKRARQLLADGKYQAVLEICRRHLAQHSNHQTFLEFQREAERGQRRSFLAELQRRAAAETDLKKRVRLLERGLEHYPDEAGLAEELRFTRNKLALGDSIVEEARACEQKGQWDLAMEKWNSLLTVYGQYPGLSAEIERVGRARKKAVSEVIEREAKRIEQALRAGDVGTATELLRVAQTEYPDAGRWKDLARRIERPPAPREKAPDQRPVPTAAATPARSPAPDATPAAVPERPRSRARGLVVAGVVATVSAGATVGIVALRSRNTEDATVHVRANVSGATISIGGKSCVTPNCSITLPPGNYTVHGSKDGYQPVSGPITVAPGQGVANVDLALNALPVDAGEHANPAEKERVATPPPPEAARKKEEEKTSTVTRPSSRLEVAGAIAGAQVRVDGQTIGETDRSGALEHDIAPGAHAIELSKDDYTPVRTTEQFRAGKTVRLDRGRVAMAKAVKNTALAPPDPKQLEAQEWTQIANSAKPEDFDSYIRNHPGGAHLEQARIRAAELRQQMRAGAAQQVDQSAWERVDPRNREQLQDYLSRFPSGSHVQEARARIADADRQAAEALAAQRLREQKDQEQAKRAGDEQAITKVVRDFEAAYNQKDLAELQKLWSGIPVATFRRQFREAKDLKFQLQLIGQPTLNGNSAMALCTRSLNYKAQSGGVFTNSERVKLTLTREGSGWVIRSIELN